MEYIIVISILVIILVLLKAIFKININEIKEIGDNNKELDEIVKKYPSNVEICKSILKKIKNENVEIQEDKEANNCLYIAVSNKIIAESVKDLI